ncbi:MAG: acetamidase [Planctomycetes bacterium]|nr:acetamidase [Planctomycetota bacterium]
MDIIRFEPQVFYYTYGPHPPALRIQPGQRVETWTADSSNGDPEGRVLPRERRQQGQGLLEYNGVTGPFHVEGAEPGDTLVVHFEAIELNRASAFGAVHSHLAALGDDMQFVGPTGLKPPIQGRRYEWKLDLERGVARLELPQSRVGRVEIPTHPFLGCVGVAPRWGERLNTVDAGNHGGNLDCPEIVSGVAVHLPVNVPGALLMFGDAHAAQGDGELAGGALETTARVRFRCDVLKKRALRWPRVVNDEWIMTVASARPLLDALRIAWVEMILWLESDYGYERWDALHVLSQVGRVRVCSVVSPRYTVAAAFPRRYLPDERNRP